MIWNVLLFGILMLRRVDCLLWYRSSIGIIWIGKFLPGMVSCSDVEVVLPPRVVLRFLPWGVAPTKGRFSHSHGTEAFARMALRKSAAEDLLQATRPWQLFFNVLCCLFWSFLLFELLTWGTVHGPGRLGWRDAACGCLGPWRSWVVVTHGIEWFLLVFGIYSARTLWFVPFFEQTVAWWPMLLITSSGGPWTIDPVQSFEALSGGVSSTPVQVLMSSREAWVVALMALWERGVASCCLLSSATGQANIGSAVGFTQSGLWTCLDKRTKPEEDKN